MSPIGTNTGVSKGLAAVAGAITIVAMTGCADGSNPAAPTSSLNGPQLSQPGSVGASLDAALLGDPEIGPELAAVRRATAGFHDVSAAIGAGYLSPLGGHCDASAAGAMGVHSGNPALVQSQVLDPLRPEVLLYLPNEGGVRLVGVEYVQPVLVRNPDNGVVQPWLPTTPWPANYQVVTPTPTLFGQTFQGPMPGHFPGMPWHWDLHVWVWANNPSGMFAQWNPALSCTE
jgi:hypothetical protein